MTKIIIQVSSLDVGGVELRTLETIRYIKKKKLNVEIIVYAASGRKGALDKVYEDLGVRIVYGGGRKAEMLMKLFGLLRKERPDVFHVNASYASGIFCFIAWLAGIKRRVSHIRSIYFPEMRALARLKYMIYLPLLWTFSSHVVGVAEHARITSKTPRKKWTTLYDGIEIEDIRSRPPYEKRDDSINIIFLARYHPCKNIEFSLGVVKKLACKRKVNFNLVGPFPNDIISMVGESLEECPQLKFIYHGCVSKQEAMEILSQNDLLLLTSTREGLPGVILEASALGVPVLATNLPGIKEIAGYLPSVHTMPLSAKYSEWADSAIDAIEKKKLIPPTRFGESPFTIEKHVKGMLDIWCPNSKYIGSLF